MPGKEAFSRTRVPEGWTANGPGRTRRYSVARILITLNGVARLPHSLGLRGRDGAYEAMPFVRSPLAGCGTGGWIEGIDGSSKSRKRQALPVCREIWGMDGSDDTHCADGAHCRICLQADGMLKQPCACRGSAAHVHHDCLSRWRRSSRKVDAAYRCDQCHDHYRDAESVDILRMRLAEQREIRAATDGPPEPVLSTLSVLAQELQAQGRPSEAEPLAVELVSGSLSVFGPHDLKTLAAINHLGSLHMDMGQLPAAEEWYREALHISRTELGDGHATTLASLNNLGKLLFEKGEFAEARPLLEEALESTLATCGERHPSTLACLANLSALLQASGELEEAELLCRQALEVKRLTLGSRHPDTLGSLHNLGRLLQSRGALDEAEALLTEALQTSRDTLGAHHPNTLSSLSSLGGLFQVRGALDEAEENCREALDARRAILGDRHPNTLTSAINLGSVLEEKGEPNRQL